MKRPLALAITALPLALALSACATPRPAGPIEVTRFVAADSRTQLGDSHVKVEAAPGSREQGLALDPYMQAVGRELSRYGYVENASSRIDQIASVSVERTQIDGNGKRSPVSVGAGGSTGTYGSGVGVGIGINLGGGSDKRVITRMSVVLRDSLSGKVLWEGRAQLDAPAKSPLAQRAPAADALAKALFQGFPGNNGETIEVEINP